MSRLGIYTTCNADTHTKNLTPLNATRVEEVVNALADVCQATSLVGECEGSDGARNNDIVFQVGDNHTEIIAADVYAREIDSRVGQTEDVGPSATGSLYLTIVNHDVFLHEFTHELGHCGDADM